MKRFSRKSFSQVMIHKLLKQNLELLKKIITIETNANYNLSYGDVITFLINYYKKTKQIEYQLESKLLSGVSFNKSKLCVSIPLKRISTASVASKLERKKFVSYSLDAGV